MPAKKSAPKKSAPKKSKSLEESLWETATKLRGSVESSEYKHVVLSLIFLKFISDKFEERRAELIAKGKEAYVEFKETYTLCLRKETKEDYVETSTLKTIVAFFNSEGGTLLIGVSDAPTIVGIERELKQFHKDNDDKFLLHLKNKLKSRIGEVFYPFINYDLITVDGCKIVYVRCKQSDSPCFLDKNAFYVRTNPASDKIEGQKLIEYAKNRFEH